MVRKVVRWPLGVAVGFLAFVAHASAAGAWIRLNRKRRAPGASGAETAYDPIPDTG